MKTKIILVIILCYFFYQGLSQTNLVSLSSSCEYLNSDSIIPGIGNRIRLQLLVPVDSIGKYSEIQIVIGTTEGKSDIFCQTYPLTNEYDSINDLFSLNKSQVWVNIGEFDPDIKNKHVQIRLIEKNPKRNPFVK